VGYRFVLRKGKAKDDDRIMWRLFEFGHSDEPNYAAMGNTSRCDVNPIAIIECITPGFFVAEINLANSRFKFTWNGLYIGGSDNPLDSMWIGIGTCSVL
jgi:hypothetical protein